MCEVKILNTQSIVNHYDEEQIIRQMTEEYPFFLILLEGHQTYSVKSKSVSDVDFPDQSVCTNTAIASLLDLTSMCLLRRQVSETRH